MHNSDLSLRRKLSPDSSFLSEGSVMSEKESAGPSAQAATYYHDKLNIMIMKIIVIVLR